MWRREKGVKMKVGEEMVMTTGEKVAEREGVTEKAASPS